LDPPRNHYEQWRKRWPLAPNKSLPPFAEAAFPMTSVNFFTNAHPLWTAAFRVNLSNLIFASRRDFHATFG
jgi:hypothetical protein